MDVLKNMFLWGGTINLKHSATEFHMNTCRCLIQNQTLGPLSSVLSTPNKIKYYVEVLHITCYLIIVTRDARIELVLLTHDLAVPAFKKLLSCSNPQQDYSEVSSNLSNRVSIQEHVLKTIVLNTLIRTFHKWCQWGPKKIFLKNRQTLADKVFICRKSWLHCHPLGDCISIQ